MTPPTAGYWRHRVAREAHAATRDLDFQQQVLDHLEDLTGIAMDAAG